MARARNYKGLDFLPSRSHASPDSQVFRGEPYGGAGSTGIAREYPSFIVLVLFVKVFPLFVFVVSGC